MNDRTFRLVVAVAFTASGFSALAYQVAWQRVLTQAVGSDAISTVLIVTIFMASLGLGAEIARKVLERPKLNLARTYALIETAVGIYGLVSIPLMRHVNAWWAELGLSSLLADSGLNFVLLAPPVIGMGMTTPLIIQLAKRRLDDLGRVTGTLYGLNILGAAIGAIVTGLILVEAIGLHGTTVVAALINFAIAAALFRILRGISDEEVLSKGGGLARIEMRQGIAAIAFGFGTLAMQIALFRILTNYFTMATIVFPIVLAAYLILMSIGQVLGGCLSDRYTARLPALMAALFATGALLLLLALRLPPSWAANVGALVFTSFNGALIQQEFPGLVGDPRPFVIFAFSGFFMSSVIAWAALFPVMIKMVTAAPEGAGRSFARIYSLYTIGNVLGTFAFGLWILPGIGTGRAVASVVFVVAVGVFVITEKRSPRAYGLIVAGLVCATLLPADYYKQFKLGAYAVDRTYEGRTGVATTVPTQRFYKIVDMNRTASASAMVHDPQPSDQYQAWRWNLSELFALDPSYRPKSVLIIGIGHAFLIDALLDNPFIEKITIVDISSEVVDAVRNATATSTRRVFTDPRVEIVIADGRRYVQQALAEGRKFDLIQTKINEPWHAGSGNLFTVEFMGMQRRLLSVGGYLGVRPLAGHVRDGLEVFDAALFPGFYHVYFKNGPLPEIERAVVRVDIASEWDRLLPGKEARDQRADYLDVAVIRDKQAMAGIASNTDDRPTFEYYWLRQVLGRWVSPRVEVSSAAYDRFRKRIPVAIEP